MSEPKVWVFFYGSFINREVLAEVDLIPERVEVARLAGYDITIRPLANLELSDQSSVYGIVCETTHTELARLYGQEWVATYLPKAVLVETQSGQPLPALCYVAPQREPKPAAAAYVDRIVKPARAYGFPRWYIDRLESYRPGARVDGSTT
ncbi:MAG: gamma-glutamylcyclotransferase [Candidatus Latescibacterota bacterium]|nr:MAG: gamma-glutamylcyclotransferase [Candidatus Latescibacterota bacterium]